MEEITTFYQLLDFIITEYNISENDSAFYRDKIKDLILDCTKRELLLQKTQMVDVYEVFNLDKTIRFGICAIPNMELSFKLRIHFDSKDQLITNCEFDDKFSKWKPIMI